VIFRDKSASRGKLYPNKKLFVMMESFQNEIFDNEFTYPIWNNELRIMDPNKVENQIDNLASNHLKLGKQRSNELLWKHSTHPLIRLMQGNILDNCHFSLYSTNKKHVTRLILDLAWKTIYSE
jgi:hypothetical protein